MMIEAKILLKAMEGCIQDAMDGAPIIRAKYMSRYRMVLGVLQGIGNDLVGYSMYCPKTTDDKVSEVVRKLALGIRHQSAARQYLRFAEVMVEDLLGLIHKRAEAAEKIRKYHLALLSLLVILDGSCARMYKSWSSYINYTAGELGITSAHQLLRWKALDLITFRLTEGENKVELLDATCLADPSDTLGRLDVGGVVRAGIQAYQNAPDPAAATPHPLADFTATTASGSRPRNPHIWTPSSTTTAAGSIDFAADLGYTIHPCPPNARPRQPSNGAPGAWIPS